MDIGYREVVLRSGPARVLAVLVIAACAVAEAGFVAYGDADLLLRGTAPLALAATATWALFWVPAVEVGPAQVVLVNPFRTIRVGWPAIDDVRTRWGLELETSRGRYSAWAAPRSGAVGAGRATRLEMRRSSLGASTPRDDAIRDSASAASTLVLRQWEAYREAGLLGAVEGAGVEVRRHAWTLAVLGLLLLATVAGAVTA